MSLSVVMSSGLTWYVLTIFRYIETTAFIYFKIVDGRQWSVKC